MVYLRSAQFARLRLAFEKRSLVERRAERLDDLHWR